MPEQTTPWNIEYPIASDPVNVHGDLKDLAVSVKNALVAISPSQIQLQVKNNSGLDLGAGVPVIATGSASGKTTIAKALPTNKPILGLTKTAILNNEDGVVVVAGVLEEINTQAFNSGDVLYVGETGGLSNTRPANGSAAVGIVALSASSGIIIVEAKGNGTWGSLRDGLS